MLEGTTVTPTGISLAKENNFNATTNIPNASLVSFVLVGLPNLNVHHPAVC